jgi:hypothetical protein
LLHLVLHIQNVHMTTRKSEYKPLLFTTTMRNPTRMKGLLNILSIYNKQILTNDLCIEIMGAIVKHGLYRPMKNNKNIIEKWGSSRISESSQIGIELLSNLEVEYLIRNNPQDHKEAGFAKGWPSRFATVFDFPKELGFVYYNLNEPIEFSTLGLNLANSVSIKIQDDIIIYSENNPKIEQQVFLHALSKYQRNNPFVRVLNENVPLILLLEVISKLNLDEKYNGAGISILELPLIIFWKDNNSESLYQTIKKIREKYGYNPSWEVIIDICVKEIMDGEFKKFEPKSIMNEYPDEFIRKMRLTGLISLRGGGRFLDINKNEIEKIEYVLKKYSVYPKFTTEREYFNYMSEVDDFLITESPTPIPPEVNNKLLEKWTGVYKWEIIKLELEILANKKVSKDNVLKYLTNSTRLEFLTSLAIKSKIPNIKVNPNYPCDDEGIPTSTAGGGKGDIECIEEENGILIEVTMSEGRTQTMMEVWPITRHLEKFQQDYKNAMCYFVAPSIFIDSSRQIKYTKTEENLNIEAYTIMNFINYLENNTKLFHI